MPRAVLANGVRIQGGEAPGAKVLEMAAYGKKRRRRAAPCQQALRPRCNLGAVNEVQRCSRTNKLTGLKEKSY